MFSYLKGTLIAKIENSFSGCHLVLEVSNIGYSIFVNKKTLKELPDITNEVTIYTYLSHKEDAMALYGFSSREQRDMFSILQTVSGVGAKVALLILELSLQEIVSAVLQEDIKPLTQIKGIGPKLAKRLILELKDKMINYKEMVDFNFNDKKETFENYALISQGFSEAEAVLLSLGYSKEEISKGLNEAKIKVSNENDTQEILTIALEIISKS